MLAKYKETGSIKAKEVAQIKEQEQQLPGQVNIEDYQGIVPESNKPKKARQNRKKLRQKKLKQRTSPTRR